jgi:hypothetical protein
MNPSRAERDGNEGETIGRDDRAFRLRQAEQRNREYDQDEATCNEKPGRED